MKMRRSGRALLLLSCVAAACSGATARAAPAADANVAVPKSQPDATSSAVLATADDKKWHFALIGYVWAAGAHGLSSPRDPLPPVKLDLSFGDVMKAFKFAFMGAAEARKDRLVFLGDLMWVHLGEDKGLTVRGHDFADVSIDSKTTAITALAGYRVVDKGPVTIDLLAGARLNGNKQAFDYTGPLNNVSASLSKTWVDPIIATRIQAPLGNRVSASLYGDIGGFGIGSDLTWQAAGTVNYRINRNMWLGAGWRYFKINYDTSSGFLYDVAQSGPIFVLRTEF